SRRRHTRLSRDWSSDVCSSDLRSDVHTSLPFPGNCICYLILQTTFSKEVHRFQARASRESQCSCRPAATSRCYHREALCLSFSGSTFCLLHRHGIFSALG